MVQHIHHMGAAYPGWIVETRLIEAARLQINDALLGMRLHVLLGAKDDGPRWTSLDAGGLEAHCNPVGAQRAFVGLFVFLGNSWNVEWTACHAIAAADAVLF